MTGERAMAAGGRPGVHREDDVRRRPPPDASRWHLWLLVPVVAPLLTPVYNRTGPPLFGMPFFYWFQLGLALLSTLVITVLHVTKRRD